VSDYGEWESRLQACNDAGCGAPIMYKYSVEPAPERAAAGLRLAPALDADGKRLPLTVAASWEAVPGAVSYTLDWWWAGADSQAEEQPDAARSTRGARGESSKNEDSQDQAQDQAQNQLTVLADRTGANFTVPKGGKYRARLRVNGESGGVIATDENEMEVLSYLRGHARLVYEIVIGSITGLEAEPVDGGVKMSWNNPRKPAITKYQYRALHSDDWDDWDWNVRSHQYQNLGWVDAPGTGAGTTSYTVTGLDDGATYVVWMRAMAGSDPYFFQRWVILTTPGYVTVDSSIYGTTDYDTDDDGLIEIGSAAQLNAIRWDLDGDGAVAPGVLASYGTAFPGRLQSMGCPETGCIGYEIGTGADGEAAITIDLDTEPYNTGAGWVPMGACVSAFDPCSFDAVLEGNGNVIDNLFINFINRNAAPSVNMVGLFDSIVSTGVVRNLGLTNVKVTASSQYVDAIIIDAGALAGYNAGLVSNSYSTGTLNVNRAYRATAGGLIGYNDGKVYASHSSVVVNISDIGSGKERDHNNDGTYHTGGDFFAGGLIGYNKTGKVAASYATGSVTATDTTLATYGGVGGLAGRNSTSIRASYSTGAVTLSNTRGVSTGGLVGVNMRSFGSYGIVAHSYYDRRTSGQSDTGKGVGKTTAQLQSPTGYTGIYANWNLDLNGDRRRDNPWNFGTSSEYPTLN